MINIMGIARTRCTGMKLTPEKQSLDVMSSSPQILNLPNFGKYCNVLNGYHSQSNVSSA